jgi:hypothetical protein
MPTIIDNRRPYDPIADSIPFEVDQEAVQAIREALAKRKYEQMMADAQFSPGAIVKEAEVVRTYLRNWQKRHAHG